MPQSEIDAALEFIKPRFFWFCIGTAFGALFRYAFPTRWF